MSTLIPPLTSTWPDGSVVAVAYEACKNFGTPVGVHTPVAGSYSSATRSAAPPTTRTFPVDNKDAVCPTRATFIEPVNSHLPVAGSYNSAVATGALNPGIEFPPATSTLPDGNSVAVDVDRAAFNAPVGVHEFDVNPHAGIATKTNRQKSACASFRMVFPQGMKRCVRWTCV
ncbi:MAG TPA: hypothetical protein VF132_00595 [Rudaea sp.]